MNTERVNQNNIMNYIDVGLYGLCEMYGAYFWYWRWNNWANITIQNFIVVTVRYYIIF